MPTGYTAKLMEKGQTFPEFVMTCARAFGPLVSMRDDAMDAPIPEDLGAGRDDYYTKALAEAQLKLKGLEAMDVDGQLAYGGMKKCVSLAEARKADAKNRLEDERLDSMRKRVEAWAPPTDDHIELKKFMLEQIKISLHGSDYYAREIERLEAQDPQAIYYEHLESACHDVEYYGEKVEKRAGNYDYANKWVKALRESLTP